MVYTIIDDHFVEIERADSLYAGDIDSELVWVRATLMVRVYATDRAKIVFCRIGIELVERQVLLSVSEFDTVQIGGNSDGAAHSAE